MTEWINPSRGKVCYMPVLSVRWFVQGRKPCPAEAYGGGKCGDAAGPGWVESRIISYLGRQEA